VREREVEESEARVRNPQKLDKRRQRSKTKLGTNRCKGWGGRCCLGRGRETFRRPMREERKTRGGWQRNAVSPSKKDEQTLGGGGVKTPRRRGAGGSNTLIRESHSGPKKKKVKNIFWHGLRETKKRRGCVSRGREQGNKQRPKANNTKQLGMGEGGSNSQEKKRSHQRVAPAGNWNSAHKRGRPFSRHAGRSI